MRAHTHLYNLAKVCHRPVFGALVVNSTMHLCCVSCLPIFISVPTSSIVVQENSVFYSFAMVFLKNNIKMHTVVCLVKFALNYCLLFATRFYPLMTHQT